MLVFITISQSGEQCSGGVRRTSDCIPASATGEYPNLDTDAATDHGPVEYQHDADAKTRF